MERNRFLVLILISCMSAAAAGVLTTVLFQTGNVFAREADPVPGVIQAREFQVVDEKGQILAELGLRDGGSFFGLKRPDGKYSALVRDVGNGGTAVAIFGADSGEQISWIIDSGMPRLLFFKGGEEPLVQLQLTSEGPGFALRDNEGNTRIYMGMGKAEDEDQRLVPVIMTLAKDGEVSWETGSAD